MGHLVLLKYITSFIVKIYYKFYGTPCIVEIYYQC